VGSDGGAALRRPPRKSGLQLFSSLGSAQQINDREPQTLADFVKALEIGFPIRKSLSIQITLETPL
jgi:hypothetical protein